jgi:hypothetical protein
MAGNTTSATVSGKVKLEGESLRDQGFIQFRSRDSKTVFGGPIAGNGEFTASQTPVTPGSYEVSVFNIPGAAVGSIAATGARVAGRVVEIDGTQPVQMVVSLIKQLGEVNGTVLRDGKPASGAMVVLVPRDPARNSSLMRRDQSDSDGTFTLPRVVPGKYTVIAVQNGWEMEWSNPAVLGPFLKEGTPLEVVPNAKLDIEVKAQ